MCDVKVENIASIVKSNWHCPECGEILYFIEYNNENDSIHFCSNDDCSMGFADIFCGHWAEDDTINSISTYIKAVAKCPFDLNVPRQVIEFNEVDPFNPQNTLKGYVNRRQGTLYGSLFITHVNGKLMPQFIYSAPKQHYPFDKKDNWKFPDHDKIEIYEKFDGTCVISYTYIDGQDSFLTYKVRLGPFLRSGKYGDFISLWNEMRKKYPGIEKDCNDTNWNLVFEMYGKRNKILIDYDVPLDIKFLFAINHFDGSILSPDSDPTLLPHARLYIASDIPNRLIASKKYYKMIEARLESELEIDEKNDIIKGKEGTVWYFLKFGCSTQIKCKPPSVQKYHWAKDTVSYESVLTTVINAFETFHKPTHEDIAQLLEEEFQPDMIEKSEARILKILKKVTFEKELQHKLAIDYEKLGLDINKDKVAVMQWFGKHYKKSEAKLIFNLLKQYEVKK